MRMAHRIVLADDHIMLRHGLKRILAERTDYEIVAEAGDGLELLRVLKENSPDVVVLDISMPKLRGIEAIPEIKRLRPETRIVVLTMHKDEDYLKQAITAGADGYVLKEDAEKELFKAIDRVLQGKVFVSPFLTDQLSDDWVQLCRGKKDLPSVGPLSPREREILKLIAEGRSSKEIGELLYISARTVERHRSNMMTKLNVRKTADLVRYALSKGYV
jgi:DNA-binding NarL/FixJ family response regulator